MRFYSAVGFGQEGYLSHIHTLFASRTLAAIPSSLPARICCSRFSRLCPLSLTPSREHPHMHTPSLHLSFSRVIVCVREREGRRGGRRRERERERASALYFHLASVLCTKKHILRSGRNSNHVIVRSLSLRNLAQSDLAVTFAST